MPDQNENAPKIIVDDDWKEEARREKEVADRQAQEAAPAEQWPEPSLAEIVQMLLLQATVGLGGMRDPQTGQAIPPDLQMARHYIDVLELLENKTRNNLDQNEQAMFSRLLYDLRMAFVQVAGVRPPQPGGPRPEAK